MITHPILVEVFISEYTHAGSLQTVYDQ